MLHMRITKCSLGYELLCAEGICEPHIERGWHLLLHHGCVCWVSQERISVSAVPMAPRVFFQLVSSHLASPGFSKQCGQCEQQDSLESESVNLEEEQSSCCWHIWVLCGLRELDNKAPTWDVELMYGKTNTIL